MRSYLTFFLAVFFGGLTTLRGQYTNDAESANALAIQCAVSSGFAAENYAEYGQSLAETLSMLSAEQQARVFGTFATAGTAPASAVTSGASTGGSATTPIFEPAVNAVGGFNEAVFGPPPVVAPIVAGTNPTAGNTGGESTGSPMVTVGVELGPIVAGASVSGPETPLPGDGVGDGNNGHGNDPGGYDSSNPGKEKGSKSKGSKGKGSKGKGSKGKGSSYGDGNNGHGNDPGGYDSSNQGNGKGKGKGKGSSGGDGNNGHGNDPGGSDSSNPGKGKGKGKR